MIVALPIGPEGIHRAAERMILEYGSEALARAERRTMRLQSQELDALAELWELISAVIRDLEESRRRSGSDWRV
jgi:hypothetical protein